MFTPSTSPSRKDILLTLYVTVSDLLKQAPQRIQAGPGGRPSILEDAEIVTMILYCVGIAGTKTMKAIYNFVNNSHQREFPDIPTYEGFVGHLHRVLPGLVWVLGRVMEPTDRRLMTEKIRLLDATETPVCKNIRANAHKVAQGMAAWGKNSQGYFFGFNLHLAVNATGQLRAAIVTPGNVKDITQAERLLQGFQGLGIADGGYLGQKLWQRLWQRGIWLLTGVRKNMRKLMARWQYELFKIRQRVEGTIDYLKEHLNLVTSFPRSPRGYLLHYIMVLLTYQFHMVYGVI